MQHLLSKKWFYTILVTSVIFSIPILVILFSLFEPLNDNFYHLTDTVLSTYIKNSLYLLVGTGLIISVIGISTAWVISYYDFAGRKFFNWAMILPLAFPPYIVAFIYSRIFEFAGPVQTGLREIFLWEKGDYFFPEIRSIQGAIFVMSIVFYPYLYLFLRISFSKIHDMLEVSKTLGTSRHKMLFSTILPLCRPAIVAGISVALMEVLSDFGTVQHFAVDTFTTGIYRTWFNVFDPIIAAKLSAFLMIFIVLLIISEKLLRGKSQYNLNNPTTRKSLSKLSSGKSLIAFTWCSIILFCGFILPITQLIIWVIETYKFSINSNIWEYVINTAYLAIIAAIFTTILSLIFAYAVRYHKNSLTTKLVRFACLGYAIPGSIVAVGVLISFGAFDNFIDDFMREYAGISTGLILSGTIIALIFAYIFRFLAISFNSIDIGLQKVNIELDWIGKIFGLRDSSILLRLHIPIISGNLLAAFLLIFVEVAKELPATLIIRPFNFDTLAIHTYELASDEYIEESSLSALIIVLISSISVVLLMRVITKE